MGSLAWKTLTTECAGKVSVFREVGGNESLKMTHVGNERFLYSPIELEKIQKKKQHIFLIVKR